MSIAGCAIIFYFKKVYWVMVGFLFGKNFSLGVVFRVFLKECVAIELSEIILWKIA
jgi:hypothetical protein